MAKNPAQYGLDKVEPALPLETDTVRINYPVDLRLVAECVDSDLNTLTELNPSLLRLTTPRDATYDLRLPQGSKDKFEKAMTAIPVDKRVSWRYHHVSAGDTLDSVARHYHASPSSIKEVNNLQNDELHTDSKLIIPVTAGRLADATQVAYSRKPTRYRVRRGDTVLSVADDFGVPADRLRRWNRLKGDRLAHGAVLVIYRPVVAQQNTVINSPSRHSRSHSPKRKSTQSASHSKVKPSAETASKSSPKGAPAKNQGDSGASERASAGLR
jgi:membrane-bound lytic murein transglycosylase D